MIKTFEHTINGVSQPFCVTLGDGDPTRAIISGADSAETLVIMEPSGALSSIKIKLESPEMILDQAIEKVKESGLIEAALETGTIQNGKL